MLHKFYSNSILFPGSEIVPPMWMRKDKSAGVTAIQR